MKPVRLCRVVSSCVLALLTAAAVLGQEKGSLTVQAAGGEASLTLGGLLQAQFEDGDRGDARFPATGEDRFYLRRARLNATGTFAEQFDFRLEFDLAGTLGSTTGLRAQMTDGYVNWSRYAGAQIRAGQFKTPFGFEQLYADPRLLTIERSLANDRLTLNRQLGAQLWGDLLDKRLSYAVGVFNGNGVNNSANDNGKFLWAGRLAVTPWKGNLFGGPASWAIGGNAFQSEDTALSLPDLNLDSTPTTADKDNLFTGKRHGFGVDSQLETGPFSLWVEYLRNHLEPTDARPAAQFDSDGWYAQAGIFLVPKRLQLVLKYETFDPSRQVASNEVSTDTVGLNYYIHGNNLKLQLDYLRTDLPGNTDTQNKVMMRLQAWF
jgi:phosphate-selective porin OprO and OprP